MFRDNKTAVLLFLILAVGIFLRSYNFHDWLRFREDQIRDAYLAGEVIAGRSSWPLLGPYMSYSGKGDHTEENSFHVGPIYYYFQISSLGIFGDYPDKAAYPDLLFGILSVPMLYYFLRLYFERNISSGLTGLYAISAYFIEQSRYSWNTNLIPFFVLLFLFSLSKFLREDGRPTWPWVIALGFALGIGIQLHVITLALFLTVSSIVFLATIRKDCALGKKWAVVFLLCLILNTGQIISELDTNFQNTRALLGSRSLKADSNENILSLLKNDVGCHIEASSYFLSSWGNSNCTYKILDPAAYVEKEKGVSGKVFVLGRIIMLAGLFFSVIGYILLFIRGKKETDGNKRKFLRLVILYSAINFLLMIPLSTEKLNNLRYLMPIFFLPYIFLGLLLRYMAERFKKYHVIPAILIFIALISTNVIMVSAETRVLMEKRRTCNSWAVTLGEIEPVAGHLIANSGGQKTIYFGVDKVSRIIFPSLEYVLKKQGIDSVKISAGDENDPTKINDPAFFISCKPKDAGIYDYEEVGHIFVRKISN